MDLNKAYVIDIETNGLLADLLDYSSFPYKLKEEARTWCVVIRNVGTNEFVSAVKEDITKEWIQTNLSEASVVIAHNGLKFDFIYLKLAGLLDYEIGNFGKKDKLFGRNVLFIDTLLLSRLFNPDRYKGHSLEVWGERVGEDKTDFRGALIERELLDPKAPKGHEFTFWSDIMLDYCIQDTNVNRLVFLELLKEWQEHDGWLQPIRLETKLADIAIRRESLGFKFDKDLALQCLVDLTEKMRVITEEINPILPEKKLNATQIKSFTPPTSQITKKGTLTKHMENFVERVGAEAVRDEDNNWLVIYKNKEYTLPITEPLETYGIATIDDLDHVKMHLINLGWVPTEWKERDLTKDAKKQNLSYEKRVQSLDRWWKDTMNGKYKEQRLELLGGYSEYLYDDLLFKLNQDRPVRVPTSPAIRVGVEKDLCPNLKALGDKVAFAGNFALYLTYKHRKSAIAGGDIEDMDFDEEAPNTGYLSAYREQDGRVSTPAIEIGTTSHRYRHVKISNIARASSLYGKELRSLFGCGAGVVQLGFDYSSLEARVQGSAVKPYPGGEELAESLVAEKPNDVHSLNAAKLGIDRTTSKSVTYAILYGCSPKKLEKMLGFTPAQATQFYNDYWDAVPALRDFKADLEKSWESNGRMFLEGIDGRRLRTRSKHSLVNLSFQSSGVVMAKYVTLFLMESLEDLGLCTDPFIGKPDVCSMIEYHDEAQLYTNPKFYEFKLFNTEEEAKKFINDWDPADGVISAIGHSDKGYYITLPNIISKSLEAAIKRTEELLKLRVNIGFEWITGKNWAQCH